MKKFILTVFSTLVTGILFAQADDKQAEFRRRLIGTWKFVEARDFDDKKVDTIWHPEIDLGGVKAFEVPSGPLTKYFQDGTYSKQFNDTSFSRGKWVADYSEQTIILHSYLTEPYDWVEQSLIKNALAVKDEAGAYFEEHNDRVIDLTEYRLILMVRNGMKEIYRKID